MSVEGSARSHAARLLDRYDRSPAPIDAALARAARSLEDREARLLRQLVLGTLRWRRRLDEVLSTAAKRPIEKIDQPLHSPLRLAAFQLLFLDRVPDYAAVSEGVGEVRRRSARAASFANAVLRRIARSPSLERWPVRPGDPIERLAIETSHPTFLVRRWVERLGEPTARALLQANNRVARMQLLSLVDRDELAERLAAEGVETRPLDLTPRALEVVDGDPLAGEAFRSGLFYVQDQASQAAALVPPPRGDDLVFDAAAAPGGKSLSLLVAAPTTRIVGADSSLRRLLTLRENLDRLGRPATTLVADAAVPALATRFDRVVLDLPCTGTGILARHPDLKWRLTEEELARLARTGSGLLAGAAEVVSPGGLLIAITCSIEREETEDVFEGLLARRADFRRVELEGTLSPALEAGVVGPGLWRLLPSADHDGFTVQVAQRAVR